MSSRHKQTIAEQQERIKQLRAWIENEGEPAHRRCQELQLRHDAVEQELSQKQTELECLRLELGSIRKDYKSLHILYKQVSNDKNHTADELERAIESLRDCSEHEHIRKELEGKVDRLKQQNYILINEGTKMLDKLTKSEGLNATLQRDAAQYIKQLEELRTDNTTFQGQIDEMKQSMKQKEADLKARDDHIESLSEKLAAIQDHRHRLTAMIQMDSSCQSEAENGRKSINGTKDRTPIPAADEWSTGDTMSLQMADNETEEMGSFELAMRANSVLVERRASPQKMEMEIQRMMEMLKQYGNRDDRWREEVQRLNDEISELKALDVLKRDPWDSTTSSIADVAQRPTAEGDKDSATAPMKRRHHRVTRLPLDANQGVVCTDISWRWNQFLSVFSFQRKKGPLESRNELLNQRGSK